MKKNILIIGLGWQGQKFIKYFLNNSNIYNVFGCCNTDKTKKNITSKYGIDVSTNYKKSLSGEIDLVITTVFPTDIQYDIVKYILENTSYKVLIDLPITFNIKKLDYILSFEKLYLLNIEHYTKIFSYISENVLNISKIDSILFINKDNLRNQVDPKKALMVDKFYMLNNLLSIPYDKLNISYKEKKEPIKDIEFIFKIHFEDNNVVTYKYEDSKGIILNNGLVEVDNITYTNVLDGILFNIFSLDFIDKNTFYKKQHLNYWNQFIK